MRILFLASVLILITIGIGYALQPVQIIGTPNVIVTNQPTTITPVPGTAGGTINFFLQPVTSDNHTTIKASAGQVYHIDATNNSATIAAVRLYNAGSGFAGCGSATNLIWGGLIPANTAIGGFGFNFPLGMGGFTTGISICVTGGYATNDTTAPPANAIDLNVGYK